MNVIFWILTLAIISGQLIKIPFGQGGIILLDLIVGLLCFLGVINLKIKFKDSPNFVKAGLIFTGFAFLSLIFTPLNLSANEYLISLSYTIRFGMYLILGWLLSLGIYKHLSQKISSTFIISGFGLSLLGLLQFIFFPDLLFLQSLGWDPHYFRTVSTFLDPNFLGAFLVLILILLLQNPTITKERKILIFVFIYLALLTTFSRSSYLMFAVTFLTASVFLKSIRLATLTVCLFTFLLFGFWIYTQTITKPKNIDREASASYRLSTWQQGWDVFQKAPFLGVGFNSYRYAIREYRLANPEFLNSHGSSTNDSSLLYVLATTGILGFIAYIAIIYSILNLSFQRLRTDKLALTLIAGLSGLLIHSIFNNSLFYPPILAWIFLISGSLFQKSPESNPLRS